jgi:hypothetical protein
MPTQKLKTLNDEMRDRAAKALISYAIFRWESAATLAATLILAILLPDPFGGILSFWQWWFWLVLGFVAEVLIVVTTIYDPATRERVVAEMFRVRFNPKEVAASEYRQKLVKALEYREQMELLLQHTRDGALRTHLEATIDDVSEWLNNMFTLARRLDHYRSSGILQQDFQSVPVAIQNLEQRLARETDPQVKAQLEQTIQSKRDQLEQLERLDNTMERAELQLDDTLSAMGTIYAQMQLIGAKDIDSGRAQRLRTDIADQVNSLQDVVQAMDEVYLSSGISAGPAVPTP